MATRPKRTVGTMLCLCCTKEIPVKAAENGTLNVACAWCDFPAYAKAGTEAHTIISGRIQNRQAPAEKPKASAPAPAAKAPEPAQTPAPRKARSIFDLGVAA